MEAPREPSDPRASDPRAELALLADALRAHLARVGRRRVRRLPAPAARAAPEVGSAPAPGPCRQASAAPHGVLQPAPRVAPAAPHAPAPNTTAGATPAAAALRARAAACPDLASLAAEVAACTACGLARTRKQTVFSDGRARIPLMFVGEAPGADEDDQGLPFVGRAGALLSDIITKGMGLTREDVYIANVLKCRPPGNRDPSGEEKSLCTGWLDRQIELVDPRVIVPLGRHAAGHVLHTDAPMSRLRGKVHELGGRKVVPTFHPAFLLRSPGMKAACWEDIQLAMRLLELPLPSRRGADSGAGR